MIYLDYAATTPMSKSACEMYTAVATRYYGNTSSLHEIGTNAATLVDESRNILSHLMKGEKEGIYFTSGGSESNQLAIRSIAYGQIEKGRHLITTNCEHSSVKNTFLQLKNEGFNVTFLPVNHYGEVELTRLEEAITDQTTLVSIAFLNGDIGTIQPIRAIGEWLKKENIIFHCDCVQAFSKVEIDTQAMKIDSLSISSHKLYGPKGVGACYIAPHIKIKSQHPGATHEKGFRAGTLNTPGIVSFVHAAKEATEAMNEHTAYMKQLRQRMIDRLRMQKRPFTVEGHPTCTSPHILGLRFHGLLGQYLMLEANRKGLCFSTGSACSVGLQKPSDTMMAIGRSVEEAFEFIRLTFSSQTTMIEIDEASKILNNIVDEFYQHHRGE